MKPIDLSQFADHSQRIPEAFLGTQISADRPLKVLDVLSTHLVDFIAIGQCFVWMRFTLEVTFNHLMITQHLVKAWNATGGYTVNAALFVLAAFTYFAASYFLNQGQTPGMKLFKKRVSMPMHSFSHAWKWSVYSMSLLVTCGLSAKIFHDALKAEGHGSFGSHDHHYEQMMSYKVWASPSLVAWTEDTVAPQEQVHKAA